MYQEFSGNPIWKRSKLLGCVQAKQWQCVGHSRFLESTYCETLIGSKIVLGSSIFTNHPVFFKSIFPRVALEKTDILPMYVKKRKKKTMKFGRCHERIDLISLANHSLNCISKSLTSNIIPKIAVDSDQHGAVCFFLLLLSHIENAWEVIATDRFEVLL